MSNIDNRVLIDTAHHRLEILRDDGVYRHLRMQQPGTSFYYYDIITWPGYLTVTGDMGTWTFSRTRDMFRFFGAWDGQINTGYWSEKLEAGAGCSARELLAKEFDDDEFCESLKGYFSGCLDDNETSDTDIDDDCDDEDDISGSEKAVIREIVRELCSVNFSNEHDAYQAVYDADWPEGWSAWDICDGLAFKTYTSHFRWILFAITWAISKYHNTKLVDKAMATFLAAKGSAL